VSLRSCLAVVACLALGALGPTESRADFALAAACSGCHAGPANEATEGIVSLDGRDAETIAALFLRYKTETDGGTVMHRLARGYSDEEIAAIAAYLAAEGN